MQKFEKQRNHSLLGLTSRVREIKRDRYRRKNSEIEIEKLRHKEKDMKNATNKSAKP